MDKEGRLSLDMLIGLSIFLVTFIFIAQFLPTVFADVRSEISLAHEAYKVTVLLAETEGAWSNGTHNGTNWEDYESQWGDTDFVFLPGLTGGEPDYLEFDKLKALQKATENYYDKVREMLGLLTPDRNYNFHVSLESLDSKPYNRTLVRDKDGKVVLDAGEPIPSSGYISRYERNVWVDSIYNLTNNYSLASAGGAVPTQLCEVGENITCTYSYDFPINVFILRAEEFVKQQSPKISICGYNDTSKCGSGTCPIGDPYRIKLDIMGNIKNIPLTEGEEYDLTHIINSMFRNAGVEQGDDVCIKIAYRAANFSLYESDAIDYLAGKAVAKLVVYVW